MLGFIGCWIYVCRVWLGFGILGPVGLSGVGCRYWIQIGTFYERSISCLFMERKMNAAHVPDRRLLNVADIATAF